MESELLKQQGVILNATASKLMEKSNDKLKTNDDSLRNRPKLPLIKLTYWDLVEDSPPKKKGKKQKCTFNALPQTLRNLSPPVGSHRTSTSIVNPAHGNARNKLKKSEVVPKIINMSDQVSSRAIKPTSAIFKVDRNIRKELFGVKNTTNSLLNSKSLSTLTPTQLDNTQPLVDINEAERDLYKKDNCFKKPNKVPVNTRAISTNLELDTSAAKLEFLINEKLCNGNDWLPQHRPFNNDATNILKNIEKRLKNIKAKFNEFQSSMNDRFNNFKLEMEMCVDEIAEDTSKLMVIMEHGKGNLASNRELNDIQSNKKKVHFNVKAPEDFVQVSDKSDKGLERALKLYNSIRMDNKSLLSTPKSNREELNSQTDSISTKVQKQCFLLLDTPRQ